MDERLLKANKLSYKIKKQGLLEEISLAFMAGKITGILGPNGAGKSTLLKVLSGIWRPTSGTVLWEDQDLLKRERSEISQIISLVPQSPSAYFDYTVREIVAMGRYAARKTKAPVGNEATLIDESLRKVDASHLQHKRISEISAGERQRVYIGRALATEALVLLLDEPTANLDIRHQREVWSILEQLASENKTIIVSLHDFPAADRFCDEIAILHRGSCAAHGKYRDVMTHSLLEEVFAVSELQEI